MIISRILRSRLPFATFLLLISWSSAFAQPAATGTVFPTRQTPTHDPVMIKEGNQYYLFCTGNGINVFSSSDMKNWQKRKNVFDTPPKWAQQLIPGFRGNSIWAPDIHFYQGMFYLYYAVSAFGKNTSAIGLAINKTLDSASKDFQWVDKGLIIQSVPGRDMWNAIDPNLVFDEAGVPWLDFGSFWEGLKMVRLSSDLLSVAQPQEWVSLAKRTRNTLTPDSSAGNAALEGPFIFKKGKYFYLFVSKDYCCRAEKSDYKVVVGRSESIKGPYLDKSGVSLLNDGGTLIVQGNSLWYGAGHNAVYTFGNKDYNIFHGYDAADKGRSKLIIQEMKWDGYGWPVREELN